MVIDLHALFPETKGLDEKSVNALLKALKRSFKSDFDYLNFKQSIQSLATMGLDEAIKFKSAFATAATMGLTKDKLIQSAKSYRGVLDIERDSFADALKKQLYLQVEGKKDELNKIKERILINERKIEELKKENQVFQEAIDNADEHVIKAKEKLDLTKNGFVAAFEVIDQNINKDIDLINTYL